jgi:hypothetical protein
VVAFRRKLWIDTTRKRVADHRGWFRWPLWTRHLLTIEARTTDVRASLIVVRRSRLFVVVPRRRVGRPAPGSMPRGAPARCRVGRGRHVDYGAGPGNGDAVPRLRAAARPRVALPSEASWR